MSDEKFYAQSTFGNSFYQERQLIHKHSLKLLVLAGAFVFASPVMGQKGLRLTYTATTIDTDDSSKTVNTGFIAAQGKHAKFSMVGDKGESAGEIILRNGGDSSIILIPSEKMYMAGDNFAAFNMMGNFIKLSDVKLDVKKVGAGPTIEGHSTVHYRIRSSQKLDVDMPGGLGKSASQTSESEADVYLAPDLKNVTSATSLYFISGPHMLMADGADKQRVEKALMELANGGMMLKSTTSATSTDGNGKVSKTSTEFLVTSVREGDLPSSEFLPPDGYKKFEMPEGASEQLKGLMDALGAESKDVSGSAKDGVKEAVKESKEEAKKSIKEEAKSETKKKIKGLFGR